MSELVPGLELAPVSAPVPGPGPVPGSELDRPAAEGADPPVRTAAVDRPIPTPIAVAHGSRLIRQAFAALLAQQSDLRVVCEVGADEDLVGAVRRHGARVLLLDPALVATQDVPDLCGALRAQRCRPLIMADASARARLLPVLAQVLPHAGIVNDEESGAALLAGLRRLADGQPVIEPELAVAALSAAGNPLTGRECDVLRLAARGAPARDIAAQLYLSTGTVRNYLSKAVGKLGARSRIEAVLLARDAGWI